ncbi:MAG: cation-translocating P-type ATPase, partial [Actinobacteria bacterium]|nr:cation-translocating P-type ATPase [Actinomycetota bacterium]
MAQRVELEIEGMTCASCVSRVERALNGIDGVEATVNLATERASASLADGVSPDELVRAVDATGYRASLGRSEHARPGDAGRRLAGAALLTLPLLVLSMAGALQFSGWEWVAAVLATPVVLLAGWPFHRAAALGVRHGAASMDTLVSIGTLAAWGWSLVALLALEGADLYFEVGAVITT